MVLARRYSEPLASMTPCPYSLVLYDGECGVCQRGVQVLLRLDRKGRLRFAPLQGDAAADLRNRHADVLSGVDSLVLVQGLGTAEESIYLRSTAAIRSVVTIGGAWRLAVLLLLIPRRWRDAVYNWIARRRHLLAPPSCRLPSPEERNRFLP